MRALLLLSSLALLSACKSEPSFDERYDAQSQKIEGDANSIEHQIGEQFNAAAASGTMRNNPNAPLTNDAAQP